MLARGDQHSARTKHAEHFPAGAVEIAHMVQHGPREHYIERTVSERQTLGEFFDHLDRQAGLGRETADRCSPDHGTGIRLERGDHKSAPRQRIARNSAPGADVKSLAGPVLQKSGNCLPLGAGKIALGRIDQRVIIERVEHELALVRLVAQPDHGIFPRRERLFVQHANPHLLARRAGQIRS